MKDRKTSTGRERLSVRMPPVLYKYYAFNEWTQSIFQKNEMYFQSPDAFNDPFDSKLSTTYEGTEEQRVSRLKGKWQEGILKGLKESRSEEDLHRQALDIVKRGQDIPHILWSMERSAEHRRKQLGVFCMTSKRDHILMWSHYADHHRGFCLGFTTDNGFFTDRTHRIEYSQHRLCINLIEPVDGNKIAEALCTKAKNWKYEKE